MMQTYREFSGLGVAATPGVCYLCNTPRQPSAEVVVNTGRFIEGEGVLEVCRACVLEMAGFFGVAAPDKAANLRQQNRTLGAHLRASLNAQHAQSVHIVALQDQLEVLLDEQKK